MRRSAVLLAAAVVVLAACGAGAAKPRKSRAPAEVRAKKRRSSGGGRAGAKKRKRREAYYDDDDDDDDDDEYEYGRGRGRVQPYYKPRRKPTGPTMLQRAQAMAKDATARAVETSKVAASRAKVLAAEAAVKGHEASRLAKAYYSSEYEKFLLTATWPSDARVSPQLARRLVESVARFPARPHALPDDDPYRVTLRKLWKKMVEKDWRTTTKALYLLHALSRSTPTKNARALSRTLKSMVGDADPKSGRKYFSRRELVALRDDGGDEAALVDAYAGFVLRRALLFAAKFDDVAAPPRKKKGEEPPAPAPEAACDGVDEARLKRAQNALLVLDHALAFADAATEAGDPRRAHLLVVSCLELVVQDVVDAWALAGREATALAAAVGAAPVADGDDARRAAVAALAKYASLRPRVKRATKAALKTLRFFDLRVAADLDADGVDAAAVDAAVAAHGGAVADDGEAEAEDDGEDDDDEDDLEEEDDDEEDDDEDDLEEEEEDDDDDDDLEEEADDDDDDEDY